MSTRIHEPGCNLYCEGAVHAVLVTAAPETTRADFVAYACALGWALVEHRLALEADRATVERYLTQTFDVGTRTFHPYDPATPALRNVVWLLRIDVGNAPLPAQEETPRKKWWWRWRARKNVSQGEARP